MGIVMNMYTDMLEAAYNAAVKFVWFVFAHISNMVSKVAPRVLAAAIAFKHVLGIVSNFVGSTLMFMLATIVCLMFWFGLTIFFSGFYGPTLGAAAFCWVFGMVLAICGVVFINGLHKVISPLCGEASMSLSLILLATSHYIDGYWVWFTCAVILTLLTVWNLFCEIEKTAKPTKLTTA